MPTSFFSLAVRTTAALWVLRYEQIESIIILHQSRVSWVFPTPTQNMMRLGLACADTWMLARPPAQCTSRVHVSGAKDTNVGDSQTKIRQFFDFDGTIVRICAALLCH